MKPHFQRLINLTSVPRSSCTRTKTFNLQHRSTTNQNLCTRRQAMTDKHSAHKTTEETPKTVSSAQSTSKRNAFSELMSSKPSKASKTSSTSTAMSTSDANASKNGNFYARNSNRAPNDPRLGLLAYIQNPTSFPPTTVLRVTPDTVLIRDLYPKATIHLLLLPRSPAHYDLHPHDAFRDTSFLELMKSEAASAAELAASELSRLISPFSQTDKARNEAMNQADLPETLPPGRDFLQDLNIGIHAHPSMSHLHIHIVSKDMHSPSLKHRKHYNSFNTDFFIPLADYPLADDDRRRDTAYQNSNLSRNFECWRCGRDFGNKFARLKDHLEEEYQAWRAE